MWNRISLKYSINYTSKAGLAWSLDMGVAGRRFVPSQRSLLVVTRSSPLKDLIQCLCGTKDIGWRILLVPIVCTYPHRHGKCVLTSISAIRITQVHVIFKLPEHLGLYPHPLAYVEWFTSPHRRDLISHQFTVTCSTHNHRRNVAVISVDRFMHPCHLQGQCGKNVCLDWSLDNVLEMASAFYVNSYIDLDTFIALCGE